MKYMAFTGLNRTNKSELEQIKSLSRTNKSEVEHFGNEFHYLLTEQIKAKKNTIKLVLHLIIRTLYYPCSNN